jgi:hypothetical protein
MVAGLFQRQLAQRSEATIVERSLAPTDNREAAIVATLLPGAYSGVVRGAEDTTGVALIEVFALNQ